MSTSKPLRPPAATAKLFLAVRRGDVGAIGAALRAGADARSGEFLGQSPLYWAVDGGHVGAINALINAGVDVRQEGPARWAHRAGNPEALRTLLRAGAIPPDVDLAVQWVATSGATDGVAACFAVLAEEGAIDVQYTMSLLCELQGTYARQALSMLEAAVIEKMCPSARPALPFVAI